jgi:DNA-binding FadR family transcriptional regulator
MIPQRTSLVDQTAEAIRQMISSGQWVSVLPGEEALRVKPKNVS